MSIIPMNSRRRSPLLPIAGIPPILDKKNNLPLGLNAVGGWWLILWNRDIRVIMFHCIPACGPALYGLHSGGIESPLSCRLLLIAASCWWALGLIFFLCQGLVVNAKQQTVIHDLKTFQDLQRNEVSFEMFSYNIMKMFQGNLNKMFLLQNLFFYFVYQSIMHSPSLLSFSPGSPVAVFWPKRCTFPDPKWGPQEHQSENPGL